MRTWQIGLIPFALGLGLGLLAQVIYSVAHSQSTDTVVSLLRSIDRRLENIERRLERVERNSDNLSRNFDYVRDWNAVRMRVVK